MDNEVRLAKLEATYNAIARLEQKLDEISEIIIQVTKLEKEQQSSSAALSKVFDAIDRLNNKLDLITINTDTQLTTYKDRVEQLIKSEIQEIKNDLINDRKEYNEFKSETQEFLNKIKGSFIILIFIFSLLQVLAFGAGSWIFNKVLDTSTIAMSNEIKITHFLTEKEKSSGNQK